MNPRVLAKCFALTTLTAVAAIALFVFPARAADDVVTAVHGTIDKIDAGAKTVAIKTDDGTMHTLHYVDKTTVHGADATATGAKNSWHGLEKGSEVVAHYTKRGADDTAMEIDKLGDGGLKTSEGTVKEIDRGTKRLVIDTGKGTEETFRMTGHASKDAGEDVGKETVKGSKVTVYYTEEAGKKVAHFFRGL